MMSLDVLSEARRMAVFSLAAVDGTFQDSFLVDVHVFLSVGRIGEGLFAARMVAVEGALASVNSSVNLEVLAASKSLSARNAADDCVAEEGLLAGVDSKVIDELVLGLEGLVLAGATGPGAGGLIVGRIVHVVEVEMVNEVGHLGEGKAAHLTVFNPLAEMVI